MSNETPPVRTAERVLIELLGQLEAVLARHMRRRERISLPRGRIAEWANLARTALLLLRQRSD